RSVMYICITEYSAQRYVHYFPTRRSSDLTRTESDCYARYLIRVAEMRESLKIIRQALDKISNEGPIKADAPGIIPPQREKMKTRSEEHTSELQSRVDLVCRLLLEKTNNNE